MKCAAVQHLPESEVKNAMQLQRPQLVALAGWPGSFVASLADSAKDPAVWGVGYSGYSRLLADLDDGILPKDGLLVVVRPGLTSGGMDFARFSALLHSRHGVHAVEGPDEVTLSWLADIDSVLASTPVPPAWPEGVPASSGQDAIAAEGPAGTAIPAQGLPPLPPPPPFAATLPSSPPTGRPDEEGNVEEGFDGGGGATWAPPVGNPRPQGQQAQPGSGEQVPPEAGATQGSPLYQELGRFEQLFNDLADQGQARPVAPNGPAGASNGLLVSEVIGTSEPGPSQARFEPDAQPTSLPPGAALPPLPPPPPPFVSPRGLEGLVQEQPRPQAASQEPDALGRASQSELATSAPTRPAATPVRPLAFAEGQSAETGLARVIACWAAKGGVGKTTLALNLAAFIAKRSARRVIVVDWNLVSGNIRTRVGAAGKVPTVQQLLESPNGVSVEAVESVLWRDPECGLRALFAPVRPDIGAHGVPIPVAREILAACRQLADVVVLDCHEGLADPLGVQVAIPVAGSSESRGGVVVVTDNERSAVVTLAGSLRSLTIQRGVVVVNQQVNDAGVADAQIAELTAPLPLVASLPDARKEHVGLASTGRYAIDDPGEVGQVMRTAVTAVIGTLAPDLLQADEPVVTAKQAKQGFFSKLVAEDPVLRRIANRRSSRK
jgi:MinD-like ATPase involved in chromosome partitioning or flagellar assembly